MIGKILCVDHFIGLVKLFEATAICLQHCKSLGFHGSLILAIWPYLAVDAVLFNQLLKDALRPQIELQIHPGSRQRANIVRSTNVVRQVDGEA